MRINRRDFLQLSAAAGPISVFASTAWQTAAAAQETDLLPLPDETIHALNRISFGVRESDRQSAEQMGLDAYIQNQLDTGPLPDPEVEARLAHRYPEAFLPRSALVAYYLGQAPKLGVPYNPPKQFDPVLKPLEDAYREQREQAMDMASMTPMPGPVNDLAKRRRANQALKALREMTLYRAIMSQRQLYEVMVEFWGNHFSIYAPGSLELQVHKLLDDREVIRPNALGNFRTMLEASAKSPAMLYYLDGVSNVKGKPNENYARELMELHTMGVNGGYKEADVVAVARCFTGWSVDPYTGDFQFNAEQHDTDEKTVLNETIPAGGGVEDGLQVLDILTRQSATARYIAAKLVKRFVSDSKHPELVDDVALVFENTGGDIVLMLKEILFSSTFRTAADEKFKRPLKVVTSALRATSAEVDVSKMSRLVSDLTGMGQVPYNWAPPNGYPDDHNYWLNANGLIHRWQYGLLIGKGGLDGLRVDFDTLLKGVDNYRSMIEVLRHRVLKRPLSDIDRGHLEAFAAQGEDLDASRPFWQIRQQARGVLSLMLNSAYFQLS